MTHIGERLKNDTSRIEGYNEKRKELLWKLDKNAEVLFYC